WWTSRASSLDWRIGYSATPRCSIRTEAAYLYDSLDANEAIQRFIAGIIARETARGSTDYVKLPGQSFALYRAFETGYDPKNQVVYFYIEGSGFGLFDKFGWAYSRTPPGAGWPEMGWRHYRGDWYWGGG
ncbi:MAG TPA: hypothetical protein VHM90_17100, partial [Phycisphaerae bacterium]|nr:hypothetical protein [Phycisphaerae bacterium]